MVFAVKLRRVADGDPAILAFIRGGDPLLLLFGGSLAGFGLLLLLGAVSLAFDPHTGLRSAAILALGGVAVVLPGLVGVLGRWGFSLDKSARKLVRWWGFMQPQWRLEVPLSRFDRVTLNREFAPAPKGGGRWVHVVYLAGTGAQARLFQHHDFAEAAAIAAEIAAHAGLSFTPVSDPAAT